MRYMKFFAREIMKGKGKNVLSSCVAMNNTNRFESFVLSRYIKGMPTEAAAQSLSI